MKGINPHLRFNGNCREAMEFYKRCFGAELTLTTFSQAPIDLPEAAKQAQDLIMHAQLTKGPLVLMGCDTMPGKPETAGDNFSINVNCESVDEIEKLFTSIGEKGKVSMPVQETFWAARFGMLTDQYGIKWMFNYEHPKRA